MPEHSPSPWSSTIEHSNSQDEIEDADGRTIAVVWTRTATPGASARQQFRDAPMLEANRDLMTAAPILLKALRDIYSNAAESHKWIRRVAGEAICKAVPAGEIENIQEPAPPVYVPICGQAIKHIARDATTDNPYPIEISTDTHGMCVSLPDGCILIIDQSDNMLTVYLSESDDSEPKPLHQVDLVELSNSRQTAPETEEP